MNGLLFLLCLIFIFSCKEKLKEGEYYETMYVGKTINGEPHVTVKVKVRQIDTVLKFLKDSSNRNIDSARDRYIGGWVNQYHYVGPYGKGTFLFYEGDGIKGTINNHGYQGIVCEFNTEGDTIFKGEYKRIYPSSNKPTNVRQGHGIETRINRESQYLWSQYIGEFDFDTKHGKGILTFSDGRIQDGLWKYDKFLGEETFDIELSKSKVVPQSVQKLCALEVK